MINQTPGFFDDLADDGMELLRRAAHVFSRRNGLSGDPKEVSFEALRIYLKMFGWRYGEEEDRLSKSVVHGLQPVEAPAKDLDEVALRLVNGARGYRRRNGGAAITGVPAEAPLVELPVGLDEREAELLRRAMYVFRRKNGRPANPTEVILEALELCLKMFWRWYGEEQDELSTIVVYGQPNVEAPPKDLDEAAMRVVKGGGKCYSRGDCCKRTVGVKVSEEEIQAIEKLGHRREEFLDPDSLLNGQRQLRAGPGGCTFLVIAPNGESRCRVYGSRPQVCREFFCNRGPP